MTARSQHHRLQVDAALARFIETEALPGTGVEPAAFWQGFDALAHELAEKNAALLAERDRLQTEIDGWHRAHPGPIADMAAYQAFLKQIGYLVPLPADPPDGPPGAPPASPPAEPREAREAVPALPQRDEQPRAPLLAPLHAGEPGRELRRRADAQRPAGAGKSRECRSRPAPSRLQSSARVGAACPLEEHQGARASSSECADLPQEPRRGGH